MPAIPFSHIQVSPSEWGGPLNAGSGCLGCISYVLRGKKIYFERDAEPYLLCVDPQPEEVCVSASQEGDMTLTDTTLTIYLDSAGNQTGSRTVIETKVWHASGEWSYDEGGVKTSTIARQATDDGVLFIDEFDEVTSEDCTPLIAGTGAGVTATTSEDGTTITYIADDTVASQGSTTYNRLRTYYNPGDGSSQNVYGSAPGLESPWILAYDRQGVRTGSLTHTKVFGVPEQDEGEATDEISDSENDESIWGIGDEAQFPAAWPYAGIWWIDAFSSDPMHPKYMPMVNPGSPLLKHEPEGRDVLRAKIAISDTFFPGQSYTVSWAEISRRLGYYVARSGTDRGRTVTSRDRELKLEDQMLAPDDSFGSLDMASASWGLFNFSILDVPETRDDQQPDDGYRTAGFLRRSIIKFSVRRTGVFTFRIRKTQISSGDPESAVVTFSTLATDGSINSEGINSTPEIEFIPSSNLTEIYITVDWVRDSLGADISDWISLGKVRDGWAGFRQFDHAELQANSAFYRRMVFIQTSSIVATYMPDPEDPPTSEELECLESLPWMDFTQSQTWVKTIEDGGAESAWSLQSAEAADGATTWDDEVTAFDPPALFVVGAAETITATSATMAHEESPTDPEELNGATWAIWGRVFATPSVYFGGNTLSVENKTSLTSAKNYSSGGDVEQTAQIYIYPPAENSSLQIANVHVAGV